MLVKKIMILLLGVLLLITGCGEEEIEKTDAGYTKISMDLAETYMEEKEVQIVDVRTEEEYQQGHIKGAINIPLHAIDGTVVAKLKDYDQMILVYCESGNRSIQASAKFASLGYTNVYEIGGLDEYDGELVQE